MLLRLMYKNNTYRNFISYVISINYRYCQHCSLRLWWNHCTYNAYLGEDKWRGTARTWRNYWYWSIFKIYSRKANVRNCCLHDWNLQFDCKTQRFDGLVEVKSKRSLQKLSVYKFCSWIHQKAALVKQKSWNSNCIAIGPHRIIFWISLSHSIMHQQSGFMWRCQEK